MNHSGGFGGWGVAGHSIPTLEHWLELEIAQWVHHEGSIQQPITPWANALSMELHLAPLKYGTTLEFFFIFLIIPKTIFYTGHETKSTVKKLSGQNCPKQIIATANARNSLSTWLLWVLGFEGVYKPINRY